MRGRRTDLVGKKFDRLTVLSFVGKNKSNRAVWKCICKCGTVHQATGHDLVNNKVKSCGCFRTEVLRKHGHVLGRNIVTPELRAYYGAKSRCTKDGTNFLFDSFGKFIDSLKSKDN